MEAKLTIPARVVEVDDPQVIIAEAFREYNVQGFTVKHYPVTNQAYWTLLMASGAVLTWWQSDRITSVVVEMLTSFRQQTGGATVWLNHYSEDGQWTRAEKL